MRRAIAGATLLVAAAAIVSTAGPCAPEPHEAGPAPPSSPRPQATRPRAYDGVIRRFERVRADGSAPAARTTEAEPERVAPARDAGRREDVGGAVAPVSLGQSSGPTPRSDALAHEAAEAAIRSNLRPASRPGENPGVVARDWHPAKGAMASGAASPSLSATRRPDSETAKAPIDDGSLPATSSHGLRADYYDFLDGELRSVPELEALPPTLTRVDAAVDFADDASFALPFTPDTFAVLWRGRIEVPETGDYEFTCGSDDGMRMRLDGAVVLDHDGLRSYAETAGAVRLTAGAHAFELAFYENYGYASCRLFWKGPSWEKRVVDASRFSPPEDVARYVRPVVFSIAPAEGLVGDEVTIRGAGFSTAPQLVRVTFTGRPAEIVAAGTDALRVRVPLGASTGDVVVQVGPISTYPVRFAVRNVLGLFAEYFLVGTEIADYPDMTRTAPYFARLDGPLDFHEDNLWDLPFDPDVFGARFTGFLYVPEEEDYRVTLLSDDGARLSLDGATYLEMPGLHSPEEKSRVTRFSKGFHPLEIVYFENRGIARLQLFWQRSSEPTRSLVPQGCLWPPEALASLPAPHVAAVSPATAARGDVVEVTGENFTDDPRLVRVRFPGDVFVRPISVEDRVVRVRVPRGTQSGELRVDVGVKTSDPAAFTLSTPIGLAADLFAFGSDAAVDTAADPETLGKATPTTTRTETDWQRADNASFALPFPSDRFAVHWRGTLSVEQDLDVAWILDAEDRAFLQVDGHTVADCGGWHGLTERYGNSHLVGGKEYAFDLWFWNKGGDAKLHLLWTPVGLAEHLPVPARWFTPR